MVYDDHERGDWKEAPAEEHQDQLRLGATVIAIGEENTFVEMEGRYENLCDLFSGAERRQWKMETAVEEERHGGGGGGA